MKAPKPLKSTAFKEDSRWSATATRIRGGICTLWHSKSFYIVSKALELIITEGDKLMIGDLLVTLSGLHVKVQKSGSYFTAIIWPLLHLG